MLNARVAQVERVGEHAHLADDFAGREVADQPHLAGQAERAGHRAADLRRDAEGHRRRVGDEHRLDLAAVGEAQQELLGAVGRSSRDATSAGVVSVNSAASARAQLARQVGHRRDVGDAAAVDPAEDLARAEALDVPRSSSAASSAGRSSSARSRRGRARYLSAATTWRISIFQPICRSCCGRYML